MRFTGGCACGAVKLAVARAPVATRQCWCRQCQRIASGGPTINATFRAQDVIITGRLATASFTAASGATVTQGFCASCGVHIHGQSSARPHLLSIRFGALDEGHGLAPTMAIWTSEAPPWALIDPALEQVTHQPPPPPLE